jgi:hypothetical protein
MQEHRSYKAVCYVTDQRETSISCFQWRPSMSSAGAVHVQGILDMSLTGLAGRATFNRSREGQHPRQSSAGG